MAFKSKAELISELYKYEKQEGSVSVPMKIQVIVEQKIDFTEKLVAEFSDMNQALDFVYVIMMSCKNAKVSISAEEVVPE